MDKKTTAKAVNAAAIHVPMGWITQAEKPRMKLVKTALMEAADMLPHQAGFDVDNVRSRLISVASGTDPRGGTFISQAIRAAAALHDLSSRIAGEAMEL